MLIFSLIGSNDISQDNITIHNLRRLSQELENSVPDKGKFVQQMSFLFNSLSIYSSIGTSILSILSSGSTNPSDVIKLYSIYSNPEIERSSVQFLRNPNLIEIFLKDLFNPFKTINITHKSKYFYILSYATTISDNNSIEDSNYELQETLKGLEIVVPICHKNSFGSELQASLNDLKQNLM
jgi:hypothetical protein